MRHFSLCVLDDAVSNYIHPLAGLSTKNPESFERFGSLSHLR